MLQIDKFPSTRTLGVVWNVGTDTFGFEVPAKEHAVTRRGILSVIASLYDPLGMFSPVVLRAKKILQDACCCKDLGSWMG